MKRVCYLSFLLILSCTSSNDKSKLSVVEIVNKLNSNLSAFELNFSSFPKIDKADRPDHIINVTFKKHITFPFKCEEYYFPDEELAFGGTKTIKLIDDLRSLIDSAYTDEVKVSDLLRQVNGDVTLGKQGAEVKVNMKLGEYLAELIVIFKKLKLSNYTRLKVYVLGVADITENPTWKRVQDEGHGVYKTVNVHPPLETNSNLRLYFQERIIEKKFDRFPIYGNKELPNLRAAYMQNILTTILSMKNNAYNKDSKFSDVSVEILDGLEVGTDSRNRKAEISIELMN